MQVSAISSSRQQQVTADGDGDIDSRQTMRRRLSIAASYLLLQQRKVTKGRGQDIVMFMFPRLSHFYLVGDTGKSLLREEEGHHVLLHNAWSIVLA